jgi:Abortive infection alpha
MPDDVTEIAKQTLAPVGDLVKRIAGPLADELGESLALSLRPYRIRLAAKMFQKTQRMLKEIGVTPHVVPPRLFLPLMENASIQDNEDLHTRWAALLANAATSPNLVHPSFIEILKQLAPEDAIYLDRIYDHVQSKKNSRVTPWIESITIAERDRRTKEGENPEVPFNNLIRLGLIEVGYEIDERKIKVKVPRFDMTKHPGVEADFSGDLEDYYLLTDVAKAFVQACRAPKVISAG